MAKKDLSLGYKSNWLELEKLSLAGGAKTEDVLALLTGGTTSIDFEITVPKDLVPDDPPKIQLDKNSEVIKLRNSVKQRTAEALGQVYEHWQADQNGDAAAYDKAHKALETLNKFIERCLERLRPAMRECVAKEIGGKAKGDDLMTFGRVSFNKFEIRVATFNHEKVDKSDSEALDLSKALKKKKWQFFGVAWKASECVISVKSKKEFKENELKALRESLPEGSRQGAKMNGGEFKADSATNVTFKFPEKGDKPRDLLLRDAMKAQTGQAVHIVSVNGSTDSDDEADDDGESKANTKKGSTKGTPPTTASSKSGQGKTAKSGSTSGSSKGSSNKSTQTSSSKTGTTGSKTATKSSPPKGGSPKGSSPKS